MRIRITRPVPVWLRVTIPIVTTVLYVTAFPWAYRFMGEDYFDLVALPIAALAASWGVGPGLLAALAGLLINTALVILHGGSLSEPLNVAQGILTVAMGFSFGAMYDLLRASRVQTERARKSEDALKMVVEHAPLVLWSVDKDARFIVRQGRALDMLGFKAGAHVGEDARLFYPVEYPDHPELVSNLDRALHGEQVNADLFLRGRVLEASYVPVLGSGGDVSGVVGVGVDVTDRRAAEERVRQSEARLESIIQSAHDAIITADATGKMILFNAAAERMFGRSATEMLGETIDCLIPPQVRARHRELAQRFTADAQPTRPMRARDLTALRANGEEFPIEATLSCVVVNGQALATVIIRDISEQRYAAQELQRRALYDSLTGLPNRTLLDDRVERAVIHLARYQLPGALLVLDLDNFKDVNDTFGHEIGDLMLRDVTGRLGGLVQETDTLARLGGDEFAILSTGADERAARDLADRVFRILDAPAEIAGHRIDIGASIGIAVYPRDGNDRSSLLRHAEVAMYQAKRSRRTFAVYSSAGDRNADTDRLTMVSDLREAIDRGEIGVAYQPEVQLASGRVLRVEALARWRHPTLGPIAPDRFVSLAEHSGLMAALTRSVLAQALSDVRRWRDAGLNLPVAVNLSVQDMLDPGLPFVIDDLLRTRDVPASLVSLELTETVLMTEISDAVRSLSTLRALGLEIAIDDFGTGYSSLAYLARLPVDRIKIDRSFVSALESGRGASAIARAAITLAHELNLPVVAEGVEERYQWSMLAALGCDSAQGYLISRPLAPNDLVKWLRVYRPLPLNPSQTTETLAREPLRPGRTVSTAM